MRCPSLSRPIAIAISIMAEGLPLQMNCNNATMIFYDTLIVFDH